MEQENFLVSQVINEQTLETLKLDIENEKISLEKKSVKVLWARTSICTMSFWQDQKLIKVGRSFKDNNGLFSSFVLAKEEIPQYIYEYEIDSTSLLELKVHISIVDMPTIVNEENKSSIELESLLKVGAYMEYSPQIEKELNDLISSYNITKNFVLKDKIKEQIFEIYHVEKIEPVVKQKEMQVWSSKLDMSNFVNSMLAKYNILRANS